jgi:hypothetical protein
LKIVETMEAKHDAGEICRHARRLAHREVALTLHLVSMKLRAESVLELGNGAAEGKSRAGA